MLYHLVQDGLILIILLLTALVAILAQQNRQLRKKLQRYQDQLNHTKKPGLLKG